LVSHDAVKASDSRGSKMDASSAGGWPGTVDTPFVEAYLEKYHKHEKAETRKQLNARQPIGRLGKPGEIAHLVLYLCSDEAQFVHGSMRAIDGGWTAL